MVISNEKLLSTLGIISSCSSLDEVYARCLTDPFQNNSTFSAWRGRCISFFSSFLKGKKSLRLDQKVVTTIQEIFSSFLQGKNGVWDDRSKALAALSFSEENRILIQRAFSTLGGRDELPFDEARVHFALIFLEDTTKSKLPLKAMRKILREESLNSLDEELLKEWILEVNRWKGFFHASFYFFLFSKLVEDCSEKKGSEKLYEVFRLAFELHKYGLEGLGESDSLNPIREKDSFSGEKRISLGSKHAQSITSYYFKEDEMILFSSSLLLLGMWFWASTYCFHFIPAILGKYLDPKGAYAILERVEACVAEKDFFEKKHAFQAMVKFVEALAQFPRTTVCTVDNLFLTCNHEIKSLVPETELDPYFSLKTFEDTLWEISSHDEERFFMLLKESKIRKRKEALLFSSLIETGGINISETAIRHEILTSVIEDPAFFERIKKWAETVRGYAYEAKGIFMGRKVDIEEKWLDEAVRALYQERPFYFRFPKDFSLKIFEWINKNRLQASSKRFLFF